jgi:hypothetical protein
MDETRIIQGGNKKMITELQFKNIKINTVSETWVQKGR